MKSQSLNSTSPATRCSHRTAAGRQCRQLSADSHSRLCAHHLNLQKQKEAEDLSDDLLARSQNFQTAQGVNFALANIYRLLAANRISPRRATVLAYLNSLLLRTLPAIDYDHRTGHTDPTASENYESEPNSTETNAEQACATPAPPSNSSTNSAPVWDPSVPEPDPTKKPS